MKNPVFFLAVFPAIIILSVFFSCKTDDAFFPPTLINKWREIEPNIGQYAGSNYELLDIRDDHTFQLKYVTWSDVIDSGDPCGFNSAFFVKGDWSINGSELQLMGCFTDSTYVSCTGSCDGKTIFLEGYQYSVTPEVLILKVDQEPDRQISMIHL